MITILMNYLSIAMNHFNNKFKTKWPVKYLGGEEGIVAIEYGLIAAAIAVAIAIIVWAIGDKIESIFEAINGALDEPV